jgi:protoporphyrinogen oxidase
MRRRDFLRTIAGAPVLAACASASTKRGLPPGELVGASMEVGHRVRDGVRVDPPREAWRRAGIVIVGGGIAGLAAAWRLTRAGYDDFTLLELERAPGGTARSGRSPVTAYPWGAHYIPAPMAQNRALCVLLGEMGIFDGRDEHGEPVVAEQFLCRDPEERMFYRGRWYEGLYLRAGASEDDLAQLGRFQREIDRWVAWRDARGRRAFAIPTALGSDDAEVTALDRQSMAAWLDAHGLTSPRLRWLCDYACRDDYGARLEDTSAWAGLFYFASRALRPGVESRPLVTWPEGNGRLVAHLYEQVRQHSQLGVAVTEVIPKATGIEVVALDGADGAHGFAAQRVIFAAPQFLTRALLRPWRDDPPPHVAAFQYGAWMVANLHLRDRPADRGFPLAWDNVIYDSESLGYVVATHQAGIDRGPTVFTYYYPLCDRDPHAARARLAATDREGWAAIALADLSRAHPEIRDLCERIDVMRWGHAMVRARPGFVWGGARAAAARPYRGVYFANTDLSGVPLFEEAFDRGVDAAERALASLDRTVETMR